jgi:hypothetical protein
MYLTSRNKIKYLDLGDAESSLPLVDILVGGLQDTIWELIYGLVQGHPSTQSQAHLNRFKHVLHHRYIIRLGSCMQDVHIYIAQRFSFQPSPSADIPKFRLP